ncbi:hypothetical protein ACFQX6_41605 [Streptosporangium lutulentum]
MLSNSRGPQTLKELVDELGPRASAATSAEAAAAAIWWSSAFRCRPIAMFQWSRSPARPSSTPTTTTPSGTGPSRSSTPDPPRPANCCSGT